MEEHRIIQAAKLEANQIQTTPPFSTPVSTLPHPTPFSSFPTPSTLAHFPAPTPIKPYPIPATLKPYPAPTPIKPHVYPTSTPNSILPPYKSVSPTSLPIRFPSVQHSPPPFVPNASAFSFPKERTVRPLTVQRAKSRGFAHDFFSTPRKTPIQGYYFEQ